MINLELTVISEVGLHARPATVFVQEAGKFQSLIQVRNSTSNSDWVDAKSILSVLTLGVGQGQSIQLQIEGADEADAATKLQSLVENDFNAAG